MQTIELTDDVYRRVQAFTDVYRAVMDEDADLPTCFGILLDRGFKTALADVLQHQDPQVLLESMQQLASRYPEAVCGYIAEMISIGAEVRTLAR